MPTVEVSDKTYSELQRFKKRFQSYVKELGIDVDDDLSVSEALGHARIFFSDPEKRKGYLEEFEKGLRKDLLNSLNREQRKKLFEQFRRKIAKKGK